VETGTGGDRGGTGDRGSGGDHGSAGDGIGAADQGASSDRALSDLSAAGDGPALDMALLTDGGLRDMAPSDRALTAPDSALPAPDMYLGDAGVITTVPACSTNGWCWQNPWPTGNPFYAVWAADANDAWAVGLNGTIVYYNGTSWGAQASGTTQSLEAVWGSSRHDVWAVGSNGTILHFDGVAWTASSSPTTSGLTGVWTDSAGEAFAVGAVPAGVVLQYGGAVGPTWSVVTPTTVGQFNTVWGASDTDVWIGGAPGYTWNWNGSTWTMNIHPGAAYNVLCITGSSPTNIWADGIPGVWQWDPSTMTWPPVTVAPPAHPGPMAAVSPTDVWGTGGTSMYQWTGTSWNTYALPASTDALFALNANDVWSVGPDGTILNWNGAAWSFSPTGSMPLTQTITAMWPNTSTDAWAVSGNAVLHWDGTSWTQQTTLGTVPLTGIWGSSAGIWVVGQGGESYLYKAGSWASVSTPTTNNLLGVWGASSTALWAVGAAGTVLQGDGTKWTAVASGLTTADLDAVSGSSASDVWAVGGSPTTSATILHFGTSWSSITGLPAKLGLRGVWAPDSTHAFAVGAPGFNSRVPPMLAWNGTAWSAADVGADVNLSFDGVWGTSPTDVWAAGTWVSQGNVSHFDGTTWTDDRTSPPSALAGVTGIGTTDTWIFGAGGEILHR
jgi:hypothetical protein